ncbi:MAG: MATE family efflux transporter [Eubacterium sp.]|nr:MATE family efflux transporter [Eubacterium sp.]
MEKTLKTNSANQAENILGYEKIGKLLKMYAVPSIISMLVNALYNIVDQIFIGRCVGYLGNGATNIIFPITIVFAAFALMFGDGSSAYLSLMLGANKKEEAGNGVANGIILSVAVSIIFTAGVLIFFPQLLNIFGCTPELEPYAKEYGYIIAMGLPFMMTCATINSIIRADGSPKYAMGSMLAGSVLNVILDPVFIFVLKLGVKGVAAATVISQITSFLLNVVRLKKLKNINLKNNFKFNFSVSVRVSTLGISSFITQMFAALVMGMQNNLLKTYGAASVYGSEIPITVLGIVVKVNEILNSIILGLAMGSQPIIGYNYGAENYSRVKKTLKTVILCGLVISAAAFILFETIPDKIILLFGGNGGSDYIEFAKISFKIYSLFIIGNSVQMPIVTFLQSMGRGGKSSLLSLAKQALFPIPGMLLLGRLFGIIGVLYARPVSDGLAFLLAVILLTAELRSFGKSKIKSVALTGGTDNENIHNRQILITVSREYGSGGRYIGKMIAEKLRIGFYDKKLIIKLAEKTGLSEKYIENSEQKRNVLSDFNKGYYGEPSNEDELFIKESEIIKEIADNESCVIIGRCADYILENRKELIKVFIYSNMPDKVKRAVAYYGLDKDKAEKEIRKNDKERAIHYKHYTNRDWTDKSNYDICMNSDFLGVEKTAEIICEMINERLGSLKK